MLLSNTGGREGGYTMAADSVCVCGEEEDRGGRGLAAGLYASSSKPMPILCPPLLKFFPSNKAERVTLMPEDKRIGSRL